MCNKKNYDYEKIERKENGETRLTFTSRNDASIQKKFKLEMICKIVKLNCYDTLLQEYNNTHSGVKTVRSKF